MTTASFTIAVDPKGVFSAGLTDLEKRNLPFALAQGINATAFDVRQRWAEVMPRLFDRPTRFTLDAVLYTKATKQNLTGEVFIRGSGAVGDPGAFKGTPPAKYLDPEVTGGARRTKRFEKALQARGILPPGWYAVPGKGAQLDAFGNIPASMIVRILSQLRAFGEQGYKANETDATRDKRRKREAKQNRGDFFAVPTRRNGLAPGIYQRIRSGQGRATVPILIFVKRASYKARYPLFSMAKTIFDRRFEANFRTELAKAVQSSFSRAFQ